MSNLSGNRHQDRTWVCKGSLRWEQRRKRRREQGKVASPLCSLHTYDEFRHEWFIYRHLVHSCFSVFMAIQDDSCQNMCNPMITQQMKACKQIPYNHNGCKFTSLKKANVANNMVHEILRIWINVYSFRMRTFWPAEMHSICPIFWLLLSE